ncbi:MAG: hypothetical protein ACK4LA_06055 [Aquificaceae bacterium]
MRKLLYGKKIELVIDGAILDIANVNRTKTQKIWRLKGSKAWWAKRYRKIRQRVWCMWIGVIGVVRMWWCICICAIGYSFYRRFV